MSGVWAVSSNRASTDVELLSVLIRAGSSWSTSEKLAGGLLEHFGGIKSLLHAEASHLLAQPGVGEARAAIIATLPVFARRYYELSLPAGCAIKSPTDTEAFLQSRLQHLGHELFCCLYLDNRHRVLKFDELFRGTIDGTSVYPREVVKEALAVNAAAVILAHTPPSGVAEPSMADERITKRLKAALELVDIRLLDHLIVGQGPAVSLASRGLI